MNTTSTQRPGGLTALCVLTIVLGSLGLLMGLSAIGSLLFQGQMQNAIAQLQPDAEAAKVQQEIAEETNALMRQHLVRNWIFAVVRLNVAMALLLGGIWSLGLKRIGRATLLVVFAIGILFEIAQIWPLLEDRQLTAQTFDRMMQAQMHKQQQPNTPQGFDAPMKMIGQVVAAMQMVMMVVLLLAKCGFYTFGLWYLTRPATAGRFVRPKSVDPQWA